MGLSSTQKTHILIQENENLQDPIEIKIIPQHVDDYGKDGFQASFTSSSVITLPQRAVCRKYKSTIDLEVS